MAKLQLGGAKGEEEMSQTPRFHSHFSSSKIIKAVGKGEQTPKALTFARSTVDWPTMRQHDLDTRLVNKDEGRDSLLNVTQLRGGGRNCSANVNHGDW